MFWKVTVLVEACKSCRNAFELEHHGAGSRGAGAGGAGAGGAGAGGAGSAGGVGSTGSEVI